MRETLRYPWSDALTLETGAEGAYNFLDGETSFFFNGQSVTLPDANAHVDEKRGEVFGQGTWKIASIIVDGREVDDPQIKGSKLAFEGDEYTATLGEQTLNVVAALTAVLFWGGVLFLLWRMMVTARRNGPFTARVATTMRRLGWFIIIGSTIAAVVHLIAVDTLLTVMTKITNPFPNLILMPLHLPIPILTGAALLTFARIVTAGAAMDAEIQATI